MVVAFAPLVGFLLGISAITVPWGTLLTLTLMTAVTIYHNPACGTSRNTLSKRRRRLTPPDRATLESLLARMSLKPRQLLREKESAYAELGLADARLSDAALLDAILPALRSGARYFAPPPTRPLHQR
jgi:hypothetical protein